MSSKESYEKWNRRIAFAGVGIAVVSICIAWASYCQSEEALEWQKELDRAKNRTNIQFEGTLLIDSIHYSPDPRDTELLLNNSRYPCGASLSAWMKIFNAGQRPITIDSAFAYYSGSSNGFNRHWGCADGELIDCAGAEYCTFPIVINPREQCRLLVTVPWVMANNSAQHLAKVVRDSGWVESTAFAAALDPAFNQSILPLALAYYTPMLLATDVEINNDHRFRLWHTSDSDHAVIYEVHLASGHSAKVTDRLADIFVHVASGNPGYRMGGEPLPVSVVTSGDTANFQLSVTP